MKSYLSFLSGIIFFFFSFKEQQKPLIKEVNIGYNLVDSIYFINTENIIKNGIVFPNKNIQSDGSIISTIKFRFNVKPSKEKLFYKIYYQNESYKFHEHESLCHENFYGSWYDTIGFKEVTSEVVIDSFIIAGNPRFEKQYFGASIDSFFINENKIQKVINSINSTPEWKLLVEKKAKNNKVTFEEQAYIDALWVLNNTRHIGTINHPWKRNPRMGKYSALLIVCTESALKKIPHYIQFIHYTNANGNFINPYQYFLFGAGKNINDISVFLDTFLVSIALKILPGKGIWVDKTKVPYTTSIISNNYCDTGKKLFNESLFEHFFSNENRSFKMNTIPVVSDWTTDDFTLSDYKLYKKIYSNPHKRISSWIRNVPCACCNVKLTDKYIEIFTPPSDSISNAAKVNIGVKTRVGVTYGKITAKVKFSPMLNKNNIWHGITYAVWLISQEMHPWNNRRYSKSGYIPKENPNGQRKHYTPYSEIDFEIVKTSPYWPYEYYKDSVQKNKSANYDGTKNRDIIIALTNWDLASKDPVYFRSPLQIIKHKDKYYEAMRWSDSYQAITIRKPVNHDEVFNREYYFFQIEWKPREIIWRIGPDKNNLFEIGYMSDKNTSIPDNQMVLIINQEYHLTKWWPVPVYEQDYIPFLKNSVNAKIFEITIE